MNATIETILSRRSIRSFQDKPLKEEELKTIMDCALHAPSARGLQTWKFTVIESREKIQELAKAMGEALGRAGYDMYQPQVIIIPSNERTSPYGMEDNACALENIFLAAHSMGIGSVWINQLRDICDDPEIRSILTEWEVPENHVVFGCAALGYAAESTAKELEKKGTVHFVE